MLDAAIQIEVLVRQGIKSLAHCLSCYWPAQGEVDVTEANYSLHIAHAFHCAGCWTYATPQLRGSANEHSDLLAIDPDDKWIVLNESKRLLGTEEATKLGRDWLRMLDAKMPIQSIQLPVGFQCYACLIASVWEHHYVDWWESHPRPPRPTGSRSDEHWTDLKAALDGSAHCGAVAIHRRPGWDQHWIVYAIIKMSDDHWTGAST